MPHGHCYLWDPSLIALHVVSDGLVALAYLSIPFTLAGLVRRRRDVPFDWMFLCFEIFIVACGATHAMEIVTLWTPLYWLSGAIKAVTAVASVVTAFLLLSLVPKVLQLPNSGELAEAHDEVRRSEEKFRRFLEARARRDRHRRLATARSSSSTPRPRSSSATRGDELLGDCGRACSSRERFRQQHPGHRASYLRGADRSAPMGSGPRSARAAQGRHRVPGGDQPQPARDPRTAGSSRAAIRDVSEHKTTETALRLANGELEVFSYSVGPRPARAAAGDSGFSQVLLEVRRELDEAEDYLQEIVLNARKMGDLIDGLLSLARVDAERARRERDHRRPWSRAAGASSRGGGAGAQGGGSSSAENQTWPGRPRSGAGDDRTSVGNAWKFTRHVRGRPRRVRRDDEGRRAIRLLRARQWRRDSTWPTPASCSRPSSGSNGRGVRGDGHRARDRPAHRAPSRGEHLGRGQGSARGLRSTPRSLLDNTDEVEAGPVEKSDLAGRRQLQRREVDGHGAQVTRRGPVRWSWSATARPRSTTSSGPVGQPGPKALGSCHRWCCSIPSCRRVDGLDVLRRIREDATDQPASPVDCLHVVTRSTSGTCFHSLRAPRERLRPEAGGVLRVRRGREDPRRLLAAPGPGPSSPRPGGREVRGRR